MLAEERERGKNSSIPLDETLLFAKETKITRDSFQSELHNVMLLVIFILIVLIDQM
jgi:hypothetical protein